MNETLTEIIIVLGLIVLNGFFSGTEMALISLRKTRIKELVKQGNKNALIIEKLQENPENFLATIQVGITLISTIASAFAGANMAGIIAPWLEKIPVTFVSTNALSISFALVIMAITYMTVVIGELVPKSLGIKFSERFALFAARPIYWLSKFSRLVTKFLTGSSNLILKFFGDETSFSESKLSEEELRAILYESQKAGVIKKYEHEILDNIFDFSDIAADKIMTPRSKIFALDIDEPSEENIKKIIASGYSRIPFFQEKIDNIIGILYVKDLVKKILEKPVHGVELKDLLKPAHYIPNTQKINSLLRKFQKEKKQLAIVTDEHGDVDGLITIEDILEEIVGEISDEKDKESAAIKTKDDHFIVSGEVSIVDFNKYFDTNLPEDEQYSTISGFLLDQLEKFPKIGDTITTGNLFFTIKEKTEKQIITVAVKKQPGQKH